MLITTYTYDAQNRLMLTVTIEGEFNIKEVIQYTYDNNGNQLTTIRTEYIDGVPQASVIAATNTYDTLNQLISTVTSSGDTIVNAYNGDGLRVSKSVNGVITLYLYEASRVVLEQDGQGSQTAWNVYGTNLIMRKVGADTLTYMYNGHADVTALLDSNGNLVATYYYDAFGNILEKTGTAENSILYGGYQYDEETGLYYLNARMYDPVTARFLQQDTHKGYYSDPLSLNLYTYCHNEPLMYRDPTGHREVVGDGGERETEMDRKQSLYMMNHGRTAMAPGYKEYEKAQIEAEQKAAAVARNQTSSSGGSRSSDSGSNKANNGITQAISAYIDFVGPGFVANYNILMGILDGVANAYTYGLLPKTKSNSTCYEVGLAIGDVIAIIAGAVEFVAGAAGEGLGVITIPAGGAGALVMAGSTVVVTHGASVVAAAAAHLGKDVSNITFDSGSNGNTPKVEGRGQSKGGHQPENLREQLAVEEAMSNPKAGRVLEGKNTDPRWPADEGWVKKAQNVNDVEIHYQYNSKTGQIDDFKIK